jgi:hypothetical protein
MTSYLYRLARAAAWGRAIGKLASGNPLPLARRVRNKFIFRALGPWLRK